MHCEKALPYGEGGAKRREGRRRERREKRMMSFKTEFRQQLKLSPRLMQSMEILRMNADELTEYLNRVSEENPVM